MSLTPTPSPDMPTRAVPALGRNVGAIGLGCMGMSWAYVAPDDRDEQASIALIRYAVDRGVTLLDTSDAYGDGHNELLVGTALFDRESDAVVATKGGLIGDYFDGRIRLRRNGRPDHLRKACQASLERLGVDAIDLYYLHRVDPKVPIEESWGALAQLVTEGKIKALGLSEVSTAQAERAHAIHPVAAIQSELSLWTRDPLGDRSGVGAGVTNDGDECGDVVGWTRDHGAVFVPFSPLGRGFLTGRLDPKSLSVSDFRAGLPRFADAAVAANQAILQTLDDIAARHETTAAAVALAWVLAQGDHVIPIPGTTKAENLDANIDAASLVLSRDDLAQLDALPPPEGARY